MDILESIPDGVYIVDQHFNIEYINPVTERDFGKIQEFGGYDKLLSCPRNFPSSPRKKRHI